MTTAATETALRNAVTHICDHFPRRHVWNPAQLNGCRDWLRQQVEQMGYHVEPDEFTAAFWTDANGTASTLKVANLLIDIPGTDPNAKKLIIGAHYDARCGMAEQQSKKPAFFDGPLEPSHPSYFYQDTPGANDNASSVAALLVLLDHLRGKTLRRPLQVAFWVNEEYPFYKNYWAKGRKKDKITFTANGLGSFHHAQSLAPEKILGAIALDTIGCYDEGQGYASKDAPWWKRKLVEQVFPKEHDFVAFLTDYRHLDFTRQVAELFRAVPDTPRLIVRGLPAAKDFNWGWSDDWSFWKRGIPAFCVTDTAFIRSQHYHRITDTPETLNYPAFAKVVRGLQETVDKLCTDKQE
ncbi:MAG TPA: M28 family peptidase [Kiritimatiellia bacterium]|nr:M28 family peptidase [Kiritimatiellia bacterium]HMO97883.1 M28 family peptidase [Kiritimatiellia bacterium]HMP95597.1 M28 family peptidase [Kiritimatiellia bacterium]